MRGKQEKFTIGGLSKQAGVHIETIRYYERSGLIPEPPRSAGGHRLYRQGHLKRLAFIRRSRELGFSLEEIRALLELVDKGDYTCQEVKVLTNQHLQNIQEKIADLRKMERALTEIASQCEGGTVPECPIIEALFRE